jgi:phage shock protein A
VLALAAPVIAQPNPSDEDLRKRVAELEREIREISRRLSATDANGNATSESEPADEETHFTGGFSTGDRPTAREFLSRIQFSF